jgi:hypothetical protein
MMTTKQRKNERREMFLAKMPIFSPARSILARLNPLMSFTVDFFPYAHHGWGLSFHG